MQKFLIRSLFLVLLLSAAESWALPPCPGSYNQDTWTNCVGSTILPEGTTPVSTGDHYQGDWINGKPEGNGVLTGKNGELKYVGEFKNGGLHGIGTLTYTDEFKYVGEWKDNEPHGQGTQTYGDGEKYVGEWKDGLFHGQGTVTFGPNSQWAGDKYVGEFKNGKRHGQGTHTWPDGDKYVGEYKDGKRHGQGTHTWPDGETSPSVARYTRK